MRRQFRFTQCLMMALVVLSLGANAQGQTRPPESSGVTPILKATEGVDLEVEVGSSGRVIAVRIVECEGCQPTTFLPAPNIEFKVAGEPASLAEAESANGRAGTVLYHPETRLAQDVLFYGQ